MNKQDIIGQISYTPRVLHVSLEIPDTLVIGAMGGSALAGDALAFLSPEKNIRVHRDYGLPAHADSEALYIAVSHSGNTEETMSFAKEVLAKGYNLAVVSSGGTLAALAKAHDLPHVLVPDGIPPRNALLYMVRALLALVRAQEVLNTLAKVQLDFDALTETAEQDAHFFVQGVPLFYTSNRNAFLARLGMLIMDESARTPAFSNVFPELNHNEMQAFDVDMPEGIQHLFRMFLVRDEADGHRILKRMHLFEKLMKDRTRTVRVLDITGRSREEVLLEVWIRLLFTARFLAETRNINPDTEPLIEEFKARL